MGGANNWPQAQTMADWMRQAEKRQLNSERRPQITQPSDILGPGIGPFSIQLFDWNADEAAFNGFWWSEPGAINSPDPLNSKWFMGWSQGNEDGFGLQTATEFNNITTWPSSTWTRRFFDPGTGGTRSYSKWSLTSDLRYVGEMIATWSETPPNDRYLFADGREVSRSAYPDLHTIASSLAYVWGPGDSTTTFNIPDLRSRFVQGSDVSLFGMGNTDGLAPSSRQTRHTHSIPNEHMADSQNTTVGGTAGRLQGSPGNIDHDHTGSTGQSSYADFPHIRMAFHVRALP